MDHDHYSSEAQRKRALDHWGVICIIPDCGKPVLRSRLCEEHFVCKADGCPKDPITSDQLCRTHYMRVKRSGTYEDIDRRRREPVLCSAADNGIPCSRKAIAKGLCQKHYARANKYGTPQLPARERDINNCACGCGSSIDGERGRSRFLNDAHAKDARRFRRYGLTRTTYEEMLDRQGKCCAICGCGEEELGGRGWHIDHDHETGALREILCMPCNTGIGYLGDDPERLRAAAAYIERHAALR